MPRKSQLQSSLESLLEDAIYVPSESQRQLRAKFWLKYSKLPFADADKVNLDVIKRYSNHSKLDEWWNEDGFRSWFLNQNEYAERLEVLVDHAMSTLASAMISGDTPVASKITAAKLVLEAAGKLSKKTQNKDKGDDLEEMSDEELQQFIESASKSKSIEITPDEPQ